MRQFGGRKHAIDGPLESVSSNVSSGSVIWGIDQSDFLSDAKTER